MMERYALAKTRVGEIPEEQEAAQPYLDFFHKTASYMRIFFRKIIKLPMEIRYTQQRSWESTENCFLFFMQSFAALLCTLMKSGQRK